MSNDILVREAILATIIDTEPDVLSPYAIHDHPPMWSVLERDGLTLAVRPSRVMSRVWGEFEEGPGFCYGWHRNGEWPAGEQHRNATESDAARIVADLLAEGAAPVAPAFRDLGPRNVEP